MSASQRRKGKAGELEAAKVLNDEFGTFCQRTLDQSRQGGCDLSLPPFAIEVKRRKKLALHAWVKQAQKAAKAGEIPLVMARADGEEWLVIVPFSVARKWMRDEL